LDLLLEGRLPPTQRAWFIERLEKGPEAAACLADRA
jgi:hypothetical protein